MRARSRVEPIQDADPCNRAETKRERQSNKAMVGGQATDAADKDEDTQPDTFTLTASTWG